MKEYLCKKCDRKFNSKESLNKHNTDKHGDDISQPLFSKTQKDKIRKYSIIFGAIILIALFFYWRLIPPKDAPIISIEPTYQDLGMVSQANGVVSTQFQITNKGTNTLVIDNMDTSCMCTTASVISDGSEGPKFGMEMHGTNPKNWKIAIEPGKTVQLKVYYDPNAHKDLRGPVSRTINVYSNDPRNAVKTVRINLNQVS